MKKSKRSKTKRIRSKRKRVRAPRSPKVHSAELKLCADEMLFLSDFLKTITLGALNKSEDWTQDNENYEANEIFSDLSDQCFVDFEGTDATALRLIADGIKYHAEKIQYHLLRMTVS